MKSGGELGALTRDLTSHTLLAGGADLPSVHLP